MNGMINRVVRAASLDKKLYQEVEADPSLNQEALTVVIIVSIIGAVGAFLSGIFSGQIGSAFWGLFVTILLGIASYFIWSYVTHFIGKSLFQASSTPGEVLRVLGYASGPRALTIFSFIPCLGGLISLVAGIWALVAGFIGVQEALDLDTTKTLITVVIGWILIFFINLLVGSVMGLGSLGLNAAVNFLR